MPATPQPHPAFHLDLSRVKRNEPAEPLGIFTSSTSRQALLSAAQAATPTITSITIHHGVGVDLPHDFKALLEGCPRESFFILEWLRKIAMDFALPRLSADSKVIADLAFNSIFDGMQQQKVVPCDHSFVQHL